MSRIIATRSPNLRVPSTVSSLFLVASQTVILRGLWHNNALASACQCSPQMLRV